LTEPWVLHDSFDLIGFQPGILASQVLFGWKINFHDSFAETLRVSRFIITLSAAEGTGDGEGMGIQCYLNRRQGGYDEKTIFGTVCDRNGLDFRRNWTGRNKNRGESG
jgi:hypothetical protein